MNDFDLVQFDDWIAPGCLIAFLLLLIHALKSHGFWFACTWLALGGALTAGLAFALWKTGKMSVILTWQPEAKVLLEPLLIWTCGFYLSALLAKGFVERTRHAGKPVPFALLSAGIWILYALPFDALNQSRTYYLFNPVRVAGFSNHYSGPDRSLGYFVTFASAMFLFALAYRLVSFRTERNGIKLIVLALTLPIQVGIAVAIGWLTI